VVSFQDRREQIAFCRERDLSKRRAFGLLEASSPHAASSEFSTTVLAAATTAAPMY